MFPTLTEINAGAGVVWYAGGPGKEFASCRSATGLDGHSFYGTPCAKCDPIIQARAFGLMLRVNHASMTFAEWLRDWAPKPSVEIIPWVMRRDWRRMRETAQDEAVEAARKLAHSINARSR